jgi:maleylacetoacetate isomerase
MIIKLYTYFRSSAAYRVRIALHLKGLEAEHIPVHLVNNGGEQHSETFRQVNPSELVPALIEDDFTLTQSLSMIEYLEEKFPETPLLPKNLQQRALIRAFSLNITCDIHVFNIITRVGSRMPLLKSATGRLHACLQPEHIIKPLLEKEWASSAKAGQYPANWEEFLQLKEKILQQGYASVTGDMMAGIHAVAIPVYNFSRQLDHVITCIGTEDQLPADQMQQAIDYLLGIQQQIDALFNPEVAV